MPSPVGEGRDEGESNAEIFATKTTLLIHNKVERFIFLRGRGKEILKAGF